MVLVYHFKDFGAACWERADSKHIEHVVIGNPENRPQWRHYAELASDRITLFGRSSPT